MNDKNLRKERTLKILKILKKEYPKAKIVLEYSNPWELLVATILSAQCTDNTVNKVTNTLFKKYKIPKDYLLKPIEELEKDIRPTGFFRNKAKSIRGAAAKILEDFNGQVPKTMEEMITIPGVARKTANIVLGNAFGVVEGIAVDTHVKRLSNRLGLSAQSNPDKIEKDLMEQINKNDWFQTTYLLIEHGRQICQAKKPFCQNCILNKLCPSAFTFNKKESSKK